MTDKITPDEYLRLNPTHFLQKVKYSKKTSIMRITDDCKDLEELHLREIDWTGYTEPHVMIGDEFPQSRKREIEWDGEAFTRYPSTLIIPDLPIRQLADYEGAPTNVWQYGRYKDELCRVDEGKLEKLWENGAKAWADEPKPELSRFLPDGWEWRIYIGDWEPQHIYAGVGMPIGQKHLWKSRGLLHPSEGGGFQKHNPGDLGSRVDLMWSDESVTRDVKATFRGMAGGNEPVAWRPHYEEQS